MKKIGYVLADFPVLSETFVGDEMRAMAALGYELAPLIMRRRYASAQAADVALAEGAIHLEALSHASALEAAMRPSAQASRAIAFCMRQTRLPPRSLFWNSMKIAAAFRRAGCTHVHAHFAGGATAHALVAARWLGVSVSFICHGHDVYAEPEDLALKLDSADAAVAVCDDLADSLRALAPSAVVERIACGVDPMNFMPREDEAGERLLFVGRLIECKGVDDLISALAVAQASPHVDIVGDGPLRPALEAQAADAGLADRVRFLGSKDRAWLTRNGPLYDAFVSPFKVAADGTRDTGPLVVKEAMAMGLPVLTTRSMGMKEMVTPQTGFLVEPGDWRALAQSIDALSQMSAEARRRMGLAGRRRVEEHFTISQQAHALARLIEAA
ncbi:MAG: glycosyl transferase family 1 [Hyphomicrobiales bacterium]|nr:glycosyl transferase family 1 [Hyphomicrobiales bacterium]